MVVRRPRGADVGQESRPVDTHACVRSADGFSFPGRSFSAGCQVGASERGGYDSASMRRCTVRPSRSTPTPKTADGPSPVSDEAEPDAAARQDFSHLAAGEGVDEVVKFTAIAVHESSERQGFAPPAALKSTFPATPGVSYSRHMVEVLTTQVFDRWLKKLRPAGTTANRGANRPAISRQPRRHQARPPRRLGSATDLRPGLPGLVPARRRQPGVPGRYPLAGSTCCRRIAGGPAGRRMALRGRR